MNKLLLIGFLVFCSCQTKRDLPTPEPSSTYLEFRLFDAGDGDQFNAALNARVFYFPLSWSESQIASYFGHPDTNPNWDDSPRPADEEFDFDNVVAPGYGWSADPGFVHLDLAARQQIAIVFTFPDAYPRARRSYRQQLFIWDGLGENYILETDSTRAGL